MAFRRHIFHLNSTLSSAATARSLLHFCKRLLAAENQSTRWHTKADMSLEVHLRWRRFLILDGLPLVRRRQKPQCNCAYWVFLHNTLLYIYGCYNLFWKAPKNRPKKAAPTPHSGSMAAKLQNAYWCEEERQKGALV